MRGATPPPKKFGACGACLPRGAPPAARAAGGARCESSAVPAADAMQQDLFEVRFDAASQDPRLARERLVASAAARVRRHPLVPADPQDPT